LDLDGDNELPALCDERHKLKSAVKIAQERLKVIDGEIKAKLSGASKARLPGWEIEHREQSYREYTVPARTSRLLYVRPRRQEDIHAVARELRRRSKIEAAQNRPGRLRDRVWPAR
jgi:hypothetical protein